MVRRWASKCWFVAVRRCSSLFLVSQMDAIEHVVDQRDFKGLWGLQIHNKANSDRSTPQSAIFYHPGWSPISFEKNGHRPISLPVTHANYLSMHKCTILECQWYAERCMCCASYKCSFPALSITKKVMQAMHGV